MPGVPAAITTGSDVRLTSLMIRLLPAEWRRNAEIMQSFGVVPKRQIIVAMALNVAKVFTEAFGIAMILPILQYIQYQGAVGELTKTQRFWSILDAGFGFVGLPINLVTLSATAFLLIGLRQIANYYATLQLTLLKEFVSRRLTARAFHRVMTSNSSYLNSLGTGEFVSDISVHCNSAASVTINLVTITAILMTVAIYGGALLWVAPIPTIVTAALGAAIMLLSWPLTVRAKEIARRIVTLQREFSQYLAERFRGWRLVKLSQGQEIEDRYVEKWGKRIARLQLESTQTAARIQLFVTPLAALFAIGGLVIAVEWLKLSLPELTMFFIVVMRLMPLVESYLRARQAVAAWAGSLDRVKEIFDKTAAAREIDTGSRNFEGLRKGVSFSDIVFAYPGAAGPALCGVNATIWAGVITAVTGPSGAGKSTLVDLIPRLIEPQSGKVHLDGVDVRDFTLASLRGQIAYVSQQPLLFDDSVIENVRYGRPNASESEVIEACRLAHAHEFISAMTNGYQTEIGEAGASLSGGQRQRLALARVFLSGASILILDEPTSALDYESERHIREALKAVCQRAGMTVIVIAHRLSTIEGADRLLILQDGVIVAEGAPMELRRTSEWYAAMTSEENVVASLAAS